VEDAKKRSGRVYGRGTPLLRHLPPPEGELLSSDLLDRFLAYVAEIGLELYPAQEEALLELVGGKNVILSTPTGSGKSLVAAAMHFIAMAEGKRSFYTCPIKALVNEKFFALARDFGPEYVGMLTGDASVNAEAPIICCTAEVLANMALRQGEDTPVDYVVMDEFHYYADRDRGVAWQIPLLTMPRATFLLMSATIGPTEFFEERLTALTKRETAVVRSTHRPVPLDFEYRETPLHETILDLVRKEKFPVYVVNFTQRSCAEEAQNLMSTDYSTKEEKRAITQALEGALFDSPYGKDVQKFVRHGVGLHHAGLLPKYRLLVEKLAQKGHLKVICGTDTLGVGVNIPIRTVVFTKLCKFDGEKTAILSVRDFQQISGRAGRKGFDDRGSVVVQAPEHVIENMRLEGKAGSEAGKKKKFVRKKPPEKGYVHWDRSTFERLTTADPEPLVSRFSVSHGMLLNVLQRERGGCKAMVRLVRDSHGTKRDKREHKKTGRMLFQSLIDAHILAFDDVGGRKVVRVKSELQEDFSLNQALSLYLVETLRLLDPESPDYALQVLSLVEAILENPDLILMKQLDRLKTEKLAELKAAGVEYDERMAELEKLEYPKPHREFIYGTFGEFEAKHPWVGHENIRPKSIAREMYENFMSFSDYIRDYDLQRAEGLLLRYLSEVYKALVQTVPDSIKDEAVDDVVVYFRAMVRQVDSSLLDEWERMRDPERLAAPGASPGQADQRPKGITGDERAFTVLVRNALFHLLKALALRDWAGAAALVSEAADPWAPAAFEEALRPYFAEHATIRLDPEARGPRKTFLEKGEHAWTVKQTISDPEGDDDWVIEGSVDLESSDASSRPMLRVLRIGT
jgi:superfamily II RNA helicase